MADEEAHATMAKLGHRWKTRKELSCRAPGTIPVAGVERNDVLWADASRDGSAFDRKAIVHMLIPITSAIVEAAVADSIENHTSTRFTCLQCHSCLTSLSRTRSTPFNVHTTDAMTTSALGGSASLPRDQQLASCRTRPGLSTSCPLKP